MKLKDRQCAICGHKFDVELLKGNKIPKKYFYINNMGGYGFEYWECDKCLIKEKTGESKSKVIE